MMLFPLSSPERREGGLAMVVALLVTAIVFVVASAIFLQSMHDVLLSGYARRRLAAINAAEAGLNWYSSRLSTQGLAGLGGATGGLGWTKQSSWYVFPNSRAAAKVATSPDVATFEIHVLYTSKNPCTDAAGDAAACGLANVPASSHISLQDTNASRFPNPAYAIVRSIGAVGTVQRALESYVRIRAIRSIVPGVVSSVSLCLGSAAKVTVQGDLSVNNQALVGGSPPTQFKGPCPDTYSTGDLVVAGGGGLWITASQNGGGGNLSIRGGGVVVDGNTALEAAGDVWTEGQAKLGGGGATAGACSDASVQCVGGDVRANSASFGSKAGVQGEVFLCDPACPPPISFPEIVWSTSDWKSWAIVDPAPTGAALFAQIDGTTTPTVFHVPSSTCAYPGDPANIEFDKALAPDGAQIRIQTDIAIVSKCRFIFRTSSATLKNIGATHALLLITESAVPPPACGAETSAPYGDHDVTIEQNPTIEPSLFIYTPCILWIANNQETGKTDTVRGQFAARYIIVKNQVVMIEDAISTRMTSEPGAVRRFEQDVRFVREILVSIALSNAGP